MNPRFVLLLFIAPLLAACETDGIGSTKGGECRIFERPQYAVLGKRQPDQDWIDRQIEGGVGGCHWKRPAVRPASFDVVPASQAAVPVRVKKRGLLKRIKDRAVHPFASQQKPFVTSPPVGPEPSLPPMIEPPKPRDAVDELLHPNGK